MNRKITHSLLLLLAFIFITLTSLGMMKNSSTIENVEDDHWAEKILDQLTLEEKIAQLLMIRVHSNYDDKLLADIEEQIRLYQPGGVCFFKGMPVKQVQLTNLYQRISKVPILVSMDGEWGPAMRLDSCTVFPRQMALGAMDDSGDALIWEMGREIGQQCNALGIHINFAPCVDVNNNPDNPVINSRSFGENKKNVARKSIQYMLGMQEVGVSACAKHFPGHGDTDTDSHHDLPVINKSRKEMEELEFYPFRAIINQGVDMVMISHLNIPSLDAEDKSISTLSFKTITTILRKEMGFDGMVITDAMDMLGLRNSYPEGGEAEIRALLAGIDILLLPSDLPVVIEAIKEAVETGWIELDMINEKCLKVLKFKKGKELDKFTPIPTKGLFEKLNTPHSVELVDRLVEKTLTLLKNESGILPVQNADYGKTAVLCIGAIEDSTELRQIAKELGLDFHQTSRNINATQKAMLNKNLQNYSQVIVTVLNTNQSPKYNYGIYKESVDYINELAKTKKLILSIHGNPYSIKQFSQLGKIPAILIAYQPGTPTYRAALSAITGHQTISGKLPVRIEGYKLNSGIMLPAQKAPRKGSTMPKDSHLPQKQIRHIDSIINNGIQNRIFPGCQVLAIHKGEIVFDKAYGYHTYDKQIPVKKEDLYDVASITKAAATTLAVMKLYENGRIKPEDKIRQYLPFLQGTNKANITVAELMTHTSGLPAYLAFYKKAIINKKWNPEYLSPSKKENFTIPVVTNLYALNQYPEQILEEIKNCSIGAKIYKYSDLGFILLKEIIEKISGETLDRFLTKNVYQPLGVRRTCFNPLAHGFSLQEIAPTEVDNYFRMQLVHGYVHDQTAALFGGVSGHAGLFSTAEELGVIFSMLMNGGEYNGTRIFKSETVQFFTQTYPLHGCDRRSLGFDTPSFAKSSSIVPAKSGYKTYGHQGFTGTVFWCDPQNDIIYIFLSNRVYPDAEPNKLSQSRIRLLVHEEILEGVGK
ncbi:MAG: serine hydrolase [Bacteroidales bacterium]|jgi:beta-glucosidase-like glycosyl hydrolase/CubicO group peptidase (beta-lactamase class C family)|nr:serine hydrolase [Bacteroidales bacterium]